MEEPSPKGARVVLGVFSPAVAAILLHVVAAFMLSGAAAQPQAVIGVNYGEAASNLPAPSATAALLHTTSITSLRLYTPNPALIQSLAGSGISVVIGTTNADLPALATDPSAATAWVAANVAPFHPATPISTISIGNEVLLVPDAAGGADLAAQLVPAMRNVRAALEARGMEGAVKVSTVHAMAVLDRSNPPSSGAFSMARADVMRGVLEFLRETGGPFMINPYPYFAYRSDPRPETLDFCLFRGNSPGRQDAATGAVYTNMFDAQVDAVRSALDSFGFKDVEIVVAETGWPYRGDPDEAGATVENARDYNGNLVAHLRSMAGTPLMPGKAVPTYLFALYDEDLKPGPASERAFGLYRPDGSVNYDVGLSAAPTTQQSQGISSAVPLAEKPAGICPPMLQLNANGTKSMQTVNNCYQPRFAVSYAVYLTISKLDLIVLLLSLVWALVL